MATFEEQVLASLARIEKALNIGKTGSDILKEAGMGTWQGTPTPEPAPEGKIIYPADGGTVIARIPMMFVYEGDGSPKWASSVDGDLKVDGGQVAPTLKSVGEHTIYAIVGKTIVDQIRVTAVEPGPR